MSTSGLRTDLPRSMILGRGFRIARKLQNNSCYSRANTQQRSWSGTMIILRGPELTQKSNLTTDFDFSLHRLKPEFCRLGKSTVANAVMQQVMRQGSGRGRTLTSIVSVYNSKKVSDKQQAILQEEVQIGEVEWTRNLVNCVSLTGYLAQRLTFISTSRSPLAKGQLRVSVSKVKPPM